MDIRIDKDKTLKAIAEEFQARFPRLRLRFYSDKHEEGEGSSLWDTLNMELTISEVGDFDHEDHLEVHGSTRTADFEQKFQNLFGIGVQVMRRKGDHWVQTVKSDNWPLDDQNNRQE